MKQVIKTFYVYDFAELSKDAQESAHKVMADKLTDLRFELFGEDITESMKDLYRIDVDPRFSLSFSQGDGVSFNCNNFNSPELIEAMKGLKGVEEAVINNIKLLNKEEAIEVKVESSGRYAYSAGWHVEVTIMEDFANLIPDYMLDAIMNAFKTLYVKLCEEWKAIGYSLYDVTIEDAQDFAEMYGLEFYADGSQYHDQD